MLKRYHEEITRQALKAHFTPTALGVILRANLAQDNLAGQVGHDEFHFDNNAFARSYAYIEEQREMVRSALRARQASIAWAAFGRLTHTCQDLYAHSNYVDLWLSGYEGPTRPSPAEIDPMDETLLTSPDLRSGRLYYPLEILSFLPGLRRIVKPLLPRDAHTWMNLDAPTQGPRFAYAFEAARARTHYELDRTVASLTPDQVELFRGQAGC